ncbi:MAG: ABC transporter ATP-binding protein [Deltaproteobacteria bacterium]|nr:ABC transporter ATP-binding protein [Deltaproteobacteria bacterium]
MEIISVKSLTKRFGNFTAVDNISFGLKPLTINGFLGPNGAGKTTTIKMICGLLRPDEGSIFIENIDVIENPEKAREKMGYMSQNFSLYPDLTARENILFFADLYKIKKSERDNRYAELTDELNLHEYQNTLTSDLPLGIRQRVALASAVIHHPVLLFLDEPTSGVDPISRMKFFDFIRKYINSHKATAIVSTHFLTEAAHCNEIFLFNRGKIILSGQPAEIIQNFRYNIFETKTSLLTGEIKNILNNSEGIIEFYIFGKRVRIITEEDIDIQQISVRTGIDISNISVVAPSFEDVFISLTND